MNKKRIIGLTFPENTGDSRLEPPVLTVLSGIENAEYCFKDNNHIADDEEIEYYACTVYSSGYHQFKEWSKNRNKNKIIVGGYHPTTCPDEFEGYAHKTVVGQCDSFFKTIQQEGQVVNGITEYKNIPNYVKYNYKVNHLILPGVNEDDVCTSINTGIGCPYNCEFCCSPIMSNKIISKPLVLVEKEVEYLKSIHANYLFIKDENLPLHKDWKERLAIIKRTGAKLILFSSSNLLLKNNTIETLKKNNVYMVSIGIDNINSPTIKNKNIETAINKLKEYKIYAGLDFIVDSESIVTENARTEFYTRLLEVFKWLKPEMVSGTFLVPFKGTTLWNKYSSKVNENDYVFYNGKTAFLIKNNELREKIHFDMFWYQWLYFTSELYNTKVRHFFIEDTLHKKFMELYRYFVK